MTHTTDDTPMDFRFSEQQKAARDVAVSVFAGRAAVASGMDSTSWKLLGETALTGLGVAEDAGGAGCDVLELCALLVEQGRAVTPVPAAESMLVGAPAIDRFGTAAQRRELLPGLVTGRHIAVPALHGGRGADGQFGVRLVPDGNDWCLEGLMTCVPYGAEADLVLVPVQRGDGVAVVVLDPRRDGVRLDAQATASGQPQVQLTLRGVRCPPDAVLGTDGRLVRQFLIDRSVVGLCAQQVGVLDEALRLTVAYTAQREQFGQVIGSFQAVAMRAADMYTAVENCRVTMWRAAWLLHAGKPARAALAHAKYWAAEAGFTVSSAAQHLHGGMGVVTDYPLYRHTLWARQNELAFGGATEQLALLGAQLAGQGPDS